MVACLLTQVWSAGARADELAEPSPALAGPARSEYWQALVAPDEARAAQLLQQARLLLSPAAGQDSWLGDAPASQRQLAVERALVRLKQAVQLAPQQREARLWYAKALALAPPAALGQALREHGSDEARAQLLALRDLDPDYEAQEVAFQLGVLHTRRGDLTAAVQEYERARSYRSDDDAGALLGNLAEVTMLRGDLGAALALYERAAQESEASARVLSLWGGAVARDRLGERAAAREGARRAIAEDRAPMAALRQPGVFFEPVHERDYYEGLGATALAHAALEPGERLDAQLTRAFAWLRKPDGAGAIASFERVLAELRELAPEVGPAPLLGSLRAQVERARVALQRQAQRALPGSRTATSEPAAARRLDELPSAREAVALLWTLRALASFAAFVQKSKVDAPFAVEARAHIAELRADLHLD